MPLPPSTTTFSGLTLAGSMNFSASRLEVGVDVDLLERAAARRRRPRPASISRRISPMPPSPDSATRAALDELGARVRLRVVRGGAHQPAVEALRADEPVEHLGADHPGVEHVGALGDHARRGSGPPARARSGACRGRARRAGCSPPRHARERAADLVRDVAVDLLAVQPADVVCLEDRHEARAGYAAECGS